MAASTGLGSYLRLASCETKVELADETSFANGAGKGRSAAGCMTQYGGEIGDWSEVREFLGVDD